MIRVLNDCSCRMLVHRQPDRLNRRHLKPPLQPAKTEDAIELKNATRLRNKAQGWDEERGRTLGSEQATSRLHQRCCANDRRAGIHNTFGVDTPHTRFTQGSSCLATLGFDPESRWDSKPTTWALIWSLVRHRTENRNAVM